MPGEIHDFRTPSLGIFTTSVRHTWWNSRLLTTAEIKVKKRQISKKKKNTTAVDSLIWTGGPLRGDWLLALGLPAHFRTAGVSKCSQWDVSFSFSSARGGYLSARVASVLATLRGLLPSRCLVLVSKAKKSARLFFHHPRHATFFGFPIEDGKHS